jgi:beta-lactamase superfamily II metal-dependent hydrolase
VTTLTATFFDVGHGDSIVVERDDPPLFSVVDCNLNLSRGETEPKAYRYLKSKGVTELDTVVLTHLHKDHYTGLEFFLRDFDIRVLRVPPFLSRNDKTHDKILKRLSAKIQEEIERSTDEFVFRPAYSLAYILAYVTANEDRVEEAAGKHNITRLCGFDAFISLPLPRIKGELHSKVQSHGSTSNTFPEMNAASVVLTVEHGGHRVTLAGDSTLEQWSEHKRQMERDRVTSVNATVLKVPHHGSRHNNDESLYEYVFKKTGRRLSIVSANGATHPHDEYFELVNKFGLEPYCTSLAEQCRAQNLIRLTGQTQLPDTTRPFLDNYRAEGPSVACQGDITVEVDEAGLRSVRGSTNNACIYRLPFAPSDT